MLSIVNHVSSAWPELHGLTAAAIDRWGTEASEATPRELGLVAQIARLLHRISIRAGAHADQSRVVFANEANATLPVHDLVEELRVTCNHWRSPIY